MWTVTFWKAAAERAVKSFLQAAVAVAVVAGEVLDVRAVDWESALAVGAGAALLSLVTSVMSAPFNGSGPSAVTAEQLNPPPTG